MYSKVPRDFREELFRITEQVPPRTHGRLIARLRAKYPHSISFVEDGSAGPHGYNCFMYALGLCQLPQRLVGIAKQVEQAHPSSAFVVELLENCMQEIDEAEARDGSIVIYFNEGLPKHAGLFTQDGFVLSKWGTGYLWRHRIFEVPSSYGEEVRFFCPPDRDNVLRRFNAYVERITEKIADQSHD